jgi:endonuclease/exonuclease/phosphatase family metal-dependent hydrolase
MQADIDLMGWLCPEFTEGIRRDQARQLTRIEGDGIIVGDFNTGENWFQGFRLCRGTVLDHAAVPVREAWVCEWKRVGSDAKGWSDHLPVTFFLKRE